MTELLQTLRRYVNVPAAQDDLISNEIQQEIEFHVEQRTQDLIDDGMTSEDARREALVRFGDRRKIAEACRLESTSGLAIWHRVHLCMTGLLLICACVLFVVLFTGQRGNAIPPGIRSMLDNDWSGSVEGLVLGETQEPLGDALVLVSVKAWPDESFFTRAYFATTDSRGRFSLSNIYPLNERYALNVTVFADGQGMQSHYTEREHGGAPVLPEFELRRASGFRLQVTDGLGTAIPGIKVRVSGRVGADGAEQLVYFDAARHLQLQTESDGTLALPWFDCGDDVTLSLKAPGGEWTVLQVAVPETGHPVDVTHSNHEFQLSGAGSIPERG